MEVTELKISDIKPYPKNAKEHPKKQIERIAASIREFGFNQPLVIDKANVIIVGHGRYYAAVSLGMEVVPVVVADLPEEKAKAYRLADNKLNESDWEMELVVEELKSLSLQMIDLTGFDANLTLETKEDKPDLSKIGKLKSKIGDIYQLGPHKILCGDSAKEKTFEKLLGKERMRLIFTDPPYGVDYVPSTGLTKGNEKYGSKDGRIANDDKDSEGTRKLFIAVTKLLHKFSTADTTLYWWYASRLQPMNELALSEGGWHVSQSIIWLKNSLVYSPGQNFHRIYEPCMVAWKQGESRYINRTFSSYSELFTTEAKEFMDHLDIWYAKRDATTKYMHPTQKPVRLAERALKRSSEKGDIVLDAFGGSGSTLMACDQLERRARLIELDPKYVDAIVHRYVKYKGDPRVVLNGEQIIWE